MATQTAHFELEKPALTDVADIAVLNNNFDDIDVVMFANQERSVAAVSNQADAYDAAQTYAVGDLVIYENRLYKCTTAVTVAEPWDSTKWEQTTLAESGGTGVEANPAGEPTDTLEKIGIDGTIYEVGASESVSKTATGNPISITDAADAPIVSGVVTFEPIQDLHGYDKPWAGGAGKNIFGLEKNVVDKTSEYRVNPQQRAMITVIGDNTFRAVGSGGKWATGYLEITGIDGTLNYAISYQIIENNTQWYPRLVKDNELSDSSKLMLALVFDNNTTLSSSEGATFENIQVELGTEATTFEPYSNICPIEGYTDCEVEVTGKNLIYAIGGNRTNAGVDFTTVDGIVTANGTATAAAWYMSTDSATYSNSIPVKAGTYTISGTIDSVRFDVYEILSDDTRNLITNTNTSPTFTIDHDAHIFYNIRVANGLTINHTFKVQLEVGSTATPYEPYQSKTYTIDLDGTRYGGKVNLVSGVMSVTHGYTEFDGSENWALQGQSSITGAYIFVIGGWSNTVGALRDSGISNYLHRTLNIQTNINSFRIANDFNAIVDFVSSLTDWKTYLASNPLEACFELATPLTIQLTPEQIRTLEGTNNISTNMTDMSLEYITQEYQPLVGLAEENSSSEIKYGNRHSYLAEVNTDHTYTFEELGISRAGTYLVSVASITNQPSWGWFYFGVLFNADRTDTYQCTQLYGIKSNRITATLNETDKTISFRNTGDNPLTFHIEVLPMSNV